ncbi:glycyl radical protein [Pectinatus frisingensis]|uniref:glycyl radical protein n=1 Tax=Pectinatus frisingensis TaxID=865 RepID=UPI0018C56EF7|nr:formate C-acetyltransferase/glycerol dehydratase family glycyl radical enzyme [Pectinatus frisingensis]
MEFLEFIPQQEKDIDLERIHRLRKTMQNRRASICSERARLITESFRRTEGEDYILRKAEAFAYILEHMTIYIQKDSLIFGNQASCNFAAPIFPEYSIDWVINELDEFDQRSGDIFQISAQVKQELREIAVYWHGNTHEDEVMKNTTTYILQAEKQGILHRGGISMSGDGHIVPDYALILQKGLRWFLNEAKMKLSDKSLTKENKSFYKAVIISLEGALHFIKRYSALAYKLAEIETDITRKQELLVIGKMCEALMEQPVQNFYEGCETCYLVHILQMIESNGHSFCYGRFDQYMYNLYERDIQKGTITKEKALEIITHLFLMNSSNNKVRPYGHTKFSQGYPLYSNLMISGYKPDCSDGTNELSYLCIEAMNLTKMAEPNFSMRYNKNTPRSLVRLAAKLIRTGCGMPSMFNDEVIIKSLENLGIPSKDARDYCAIGCVEIGIPGKYGHRSTGMTYVNWGKLLEIMLYNGVDPDSGIQMLQINGKQGSSINYNNYDEVWKAWEKVLRFYSDIAVDCDRICDNSLAFYDSDPFASCFVDNCMKLGKTLKNGGAKYDVISQSNIGPIIVGNALAVIKKLIFDDKKITWNQLLSAIKENWTGKEAMHIHKLVKQVPKFGNDEDYVDNIVKDVFNSYLKLLPDYKTNRYGKGPEISCYTMSTSNITSYVPNGFAVGATPDGRTARSPLNEGCSPTQGTDKNGPTAVINSVAKLPNEKIAAGQLLNMRFSPGTLAGNENLDKFIDFLEASVLKGIFHNQFNVVGTKTLLDAKKYPENYTDLIVRVAGYCAQFVSLMPETQDAIIARTENNW